MLLLLLRVLLMLLLFVLSTADAGVVAADAVAAPASAGASGVAVWFKRPQWQGVKDAFGMRTVVRGRRLGGNLGAGVGRQHLEERGTGSMASRAIARSSAAVAAPQFPLGS